MFEFNTISASTSAIIDSPLAGIVIKSAIVIALAALACKLLHRQSAAVRHRVWVFSLAASLVVPAVCLLLPQFTLDVLPNTVDQFGAAAIRNLTPPSSTSTAESSSPDATGGTARSFIPQPERDAQTNTAPPTDKPPTVQTAKDSQPLFAGFSGIEQILILCWLVGTMTGSVLFLIALARQSTRLRQLTRIDDEDWENSVNAAAGTVAIKRPIVTLESDEACVPAVVGVLYPRLMVPCGWQTWSPAQRHCILLHELAHVKRRDVLTQLLGRCALLAYWFNPLVWFAFRQLRVERELACDDCVLRAGQTASDYAQQLLQTLQSCRPIRAAMGVPMAHSARLDQRVLAILDPQRRRDPVGLRFAIILPCVVGVLCGLLGGVTLSTQAAIADPPPKAEADIPADNADPVWKENYAVDYPGTLPVSVAFSADGKILLTGDTNGEVMALVFNRDDARWRWKSKVGGSHAAVAFSADQKKIYATTKDGVRILDARGKQEHLIEEKDTNPTAIGVFPDKTIAENFIRTQIVFGTPRGYFVKSWAQGKLPDTVGTLQTSTGAKPADRSAVPLAVDPKGRSAIMTGPIDATGASGGVKGKNVLWAYVCGDYGEGSPGNRVMVGHTATVVSAAWAKEGGTTVTGDATGRVIVWDAKTMKETGRLELGGRIAVLAISDDGTRTAAYVLGKQGQVFVWETANLKNGLKPIHTEFGDFGGSAVYASLSFSPDGRQLAGCAINKKWLTRLGELIGKVRVWELSAETTESETSAGAIQNTDQHKAKARRAALDTFRAEKSVESLRQLLKLNGDSTQFDTVGHAPYQNKTRDFESITSQGQAYCAVIARKSLEKSPPSSPYYTVAFFFDDQGTLRGRLGGELSKDGVNGDEVTLTRLGTKDRWFAWVSRFEKHGAFTKQSDIYLIEPKFSFPLAFRIHHFPNSIAWTHTEPAGGEHYFWPHGLPDKGEIPTGSKGQGRNLKEHLPRIYWDQKQSVFRGPAYLTFGGQPSFEIDLEISTRFVATDTPTSD